MVTLGIKIEKKRKLTLGAALIISVIKVATALTYSLVILLCLEIISFFSVNRQYAYVYICIYDTIL